MSDDIIDGDDVAGDSIRALAAIESLIGSKPMNDCVDGFKQIMFAMCEDAEGDSLLEMQERDATVMMSHSDWAIVGLIYDVGLSLTNRVMDRIREHQIEGAFNGEE